MADCQCRLCQYVVVCHDDDDDIGSAAMTAV